MSETIIACPECGVQHLVAADLIGKRVKCSNCGEKFTVGEEAGEKDSQNPSFGYSDFNTPILAVIFLILGILGIVAAIVLIGITLNTANRTNDIIYGGLFAGLSFLSGVIMLGISQVISYIGETAYNSRCMLKILASLPRK